MSYSASPSVSEVDQNSIPLTLTGDRPKREPDYFDQGFKDSQDARFLPDHGSEDVMSLPTPVTATLPLGPSASGSGTNFNANKIRTLSIGGAKIQPTAAIIIPIWIVLSSSVIIYNNYLYNTLKFQFPVFLVSWHLVFATIGTRVLARTTHLLDTAKETKMSKDVYIRSILPIAVLFCGSLILSNKAYLYLTVSFIQMLKVYICPFPGTCARLTANRHLHPSRSFSSRSQCVFKILRNACFSSS
jgi:hypothetical protein